MKDITNSVMKDIAYDKTAEFEKTHFWFLGRKEICLSLLDKALRNKSIDKILDYGCGTGEFLEELQRIYKNKEVYGADISEKSFEYCHRRGLNNIINLNEVELQDNHFDLISCLDVLEHIEEDSEFLLKIKNLLRKNGIFLVTVPAYNFLWSGEDYVSCHIRRYNRKVLKKKLIEAGFNVIKISYFNNFLFIPLVLVLIAKRIFHPRTMYESNLYEMNKFLNKMLAKLFASEKQFLKYISFPFGASIIAIVQKSDGTKR